MPLTLPRISLTRSNLIKVVIQPAILSLSVLEKRSSHGGIIKHFSCTIFGCNNSIGSFGLKIQSSNCSYVVIDLRSNNGTFWILEIDRWPFAKNCFAKDRNFSNFRPKESELESESADSTFI